MPSAIEQEEAAMLGARLGGASVSSAARWGIGYLAASLGLSVLLGGMAVAYASESTHGKREGQLTTVIAAIDEWKAAGMDLFKGDFAASNSGASVVPLTTLTLTPIPTR